MSNSIEKTLRIWALGLMTCVLISCKHAMHAQQCEFNGRKALEVEDLFRSPAGNHI